MNTYFMPCMLCGSNKVRCINFIGLV